MKFPAWFNKLRRDTGDRRPSWDISGAWMDHPRVVGRGRAAVVVSEPYQLYGEGILELAKFIEHGYSVCVTSRSEYGHGTISITVEHPRDAP